MNNIEIDDFVQSLKSLRRQPGNLADLGLIIVEPGSTANLNEVLETINKTMPLNSAIYDGVNDQAVLTTMVEAFRNNASLVIEVKQDITSELLNQLQHLADSNNLQILNFEDQELFEMPLPEKSRVIVAAQRDLIEKTITYPHFYKLFGSILTI